MNIKTKYSYSFKLLFASMLFCSAPPSKSVVVEDDISLKDTSKEDIQLLQIMGMNLKDLLKIPVFSASKHAQTMDQAPSIMSVFTRNDIEKMGVTSMIDLLKYAPGIETSMSPDGHWRVDIRGVRKDGNILLMINNQAFNDFYNGRAFFDLPLSLIEKIEIIRGPGSALYGTNAVVGVINVTTRQAPQTAYLAIQNNNGYQFSFTDKNSDENSTFSYNFGLVSSDGANQIEDSDFDDVTTDNIGETNRYIDDIYLSAFYQLEKFRLTFLGLQRQKGPYVGPLFEFAKNTKHKTNQYNLTAQYQYLYEDKLLITPKLHFNQVDVNGINEDITAGTVILNNRFIESGFTYENYSTLALSGELQFDYRLNQSTLLLAGISHDQQKMTDYDLSRNYHVIGYIPEAEFANHDQLIFAQQDKQREISALYIQSEMTWNRWLMTLGVRVDEYSDFGHSTNPRAALIYQFNDKLKFKLLTASAFRAPTFQELYDNTRIGVNGVIGNPDLEAEEIITHELAMEYQADWYLLRANFFDNKNSNIINLYDPQGGGAIGSIENTGDVKTEGGALEIIMQFNDNLQMFINLSRYKSLFNWSAADLFENERRYLANNGQNELFNAPRTRAKFGLDWYYNRWSLFVGGNYGAKASHNNTNILQSVRQLRVDDYLQFDSSIRYQLSQQTVLKFAANNLGKDKNSDPDSDSNSDQLGYAGLLQPGTTYHLSATYQFK